MLKAVGKAGRPDCSKEEEGVGKKVPVLMIYVLRDGYKEIKGWIGG